VKKEAVMKAHAVTFTIVVGTLVCGLPGLRAADAVGWRAESHEMVAGAVNPLGLQNSFERTWKRSLSASPNPLVSDAHVSFGIADRLTPAYNRLGAWVEVAPLSVLEVRAGIEPVAYFGTFKSLLAFESYDAPFDDDARTRRGGEATSAVAGRAYVAPTMKLKVGRVLARTRAEFEWWKARFDGPYFYEPTRDTLLRSRGDAMVTSETVLLYELRSGPGRRILAGAVHDLTRVYKARRNQKQDVGVVGIFGLGRQVLGAHEPMLFFKAFRYVEDPYKTGQFGGQIALGFDVGKKR
jgi:hypothetical protein